MRPALNVALVVALLSGSTRVSAQKPDDDATVRVSVRESVSELLPKIVAAFAAQQITVNHLYEGSRAAAIVAGPFPHDPATELTVRVSVWAEGDSTWLAIGGSYWLTVARQNFVTVRRSTSGRNGEIWRRLESLVAAVCARTTCVESPAERE